MAQENNLLNTMAQDLETKYESLKQDAYESTLYGNQMRELSETLTDQLGFKDSELFQLLTRSNSLERRLLEKDAQEIFLRKEFENVKNSLDTKEYHFEKIKSELQMKLNNLKADFKKEHEDFKIELAKSKQDSHKILMKFSKAYAEAEEYLLQQS